MIQTNAGSCEALVLFIILQAKKRSVKEASFISEGELFGLDTSTEYEDDDDSDWVQTPLYKRKFNNVS